MTEPLQKNQKSPIGIRCTLPGAWILGWFALFSLILLLRNADLAIRSMTEGLQLCATSLIPSLFPFMVLSELIVSTGAAHSLGRLVARPFRFLFGVNESGACAILLGMLCGFPVGTRCVLSLYRSGEVDRAEAEYLLCFCNTPSSAFLISTVGYSLFNSRFFGWLLWGSTLLSAAVSGILGNLLRKHPSPKRAPRKKETMNSASEQGKGILALPQAVHTSALSMLKICAFVVFFATFVGTLEYLLSGLSLSPTLLTLCLGAWEMTGGVVRAAALSTLSREICAALVGWSGFSVHFQMISLCDGLPLSFRPYFLSRLLQALLNFTFVLCVLHFL
ncbi:MAG: hypothetical protein IJY47_07895 [Clostridia bacterium]|nr:hypothetical protein [Clostridia bacterium]